MPPNMKALSIRQPYAWLCANGYKDIENRDWATSFRGRVLIHAGKSYPKRDYNVDAVSFGRYYGVSYPPREEMIGGIIGVATVVDCVSKSDSQWFNGPYGFVLAEARPLPFISCKGELLFFNVPSEVAAQLRDMHSSGLMLNPPARCRHHLDQL